MPPLPVCNKRITEMGSLQIKAQGTQEEGPSSLLVLPYEEKKTPYVETPSFLLSFLASSLPSFRLYLCPSVHQFVNSYQRLNNQLDH